jgi:hypothetical protein
MTTINYKTTTKFKLLYSLGFLAVSFFTSVASAQAAEYYIAPDYKLDGTKNNTGSDSNNGSVQSPIKTFNKGWQLLLPGDTLILQDGIYYQQLMPNMRSGQSGKPITVKAQNDGKAIIDGDLNRNGVQDLEPTDVIPVQIGPATHADEWFVFEGFIARNSGLSSVETLNKNGGYVVRLYNASNNIIRRVSAYNANVDSNSTVIGMIDTNVQSDGTNLSSYNNLLEDCVAAGTGRKMIMVWRGKNNIVRRCFAMWTRWDGKYWHDEWPMGNNLEIYAAQNNIIENGISYGRTPTGAVGVSGRLGFPGNDNKVLGTIAINAGTNENGTEWDWSNEPRPTSPVGHTKFRDITWPGQREGFWGWRENKDQQWSNNVFQDIFAYKSSGLGFGFNSFDGSQAQNSRLYNATLIGNGFGLLPVHNDIDNTTLWGFDKTKPNIKPTNMTGFDIKQSNIEGTNLTGEGARLGCRYVNGQQTAQALWPWPMSARIKAEFPREIKEANYKNVTVESNVYNVLRANGLDKCFAATPGGTTPTPTATPTPTPTVVPTVIPTPPVNPSPTIIGGVVTIPAKIEGEKYTSTSGRYDLALVAGSTTNYKIKNIYPPVLLTYKVNSATKTDYELFVHVASKDTDLNRSTRNVSVRVNGQQVLAPVITPTTGGWDNFTEFKVGKISLAAGNSDITVVLGNWMDYDAVSLKALTPVASLIKVEAESFSSASDPTKFSVVDTNDVGLGKKIGNVSPPVTLNYNVNVPVSSNYDVYVRTASNDSLSTRSRSISVKVGNGLLNTVQIPVTGGWDTFKDVYVGTVSNVATGSNTITAVLNTGWYDFNYFVLKPSSGTPAPTVTPTATPSPTVIPTPSPTPSVTKVVVPNPGFESALGDTFTSRGPAQFFRDGGDKASGSYSFKISSSATGVDAIARTMHKLFSLSATGGTDYKLKLKAKTQNVSDKVFANIIFADSAGSVITTSKVQVDVDVNSLAWKNYSAVAPAPAGTAKMRIEFTVLGSGEAWFDDFEIEEIAK